MTNPTISNNSRFPIDLPTIFVVEFVGSFEGSLDISEF
jgi:hypothetical protein